MAGVGYNIPISLSAATSSGADDPFSDDTYISFPGSTLSANPNVTLSPQDTTSATASAAEGNAAANSQTNPVNGAPASTPGATQAVSALSKVPTWLIFTVAGVALFIIVKHHKIIP